MDPALRSDLLLDLTEMLQHDASLEQILRLLLCFDLTPDEGSVLVILSSPEHTAIDAAKKILELLS